MPPAGAPSVDLASRARDLLRYAARAAATGPLSPAPWAESPQVLLLAPSPGGRAHPGTLRWWDSGGPRARNASIGLGWRRRKPATSLPVGGIPPGRTPLRARRSHVRVILRAPGFCETPRWLGHRGVFSLDPAAWAAQSSCSRSPGAWCPRLARESSRAFGSVGPLAPALPVGGNHGGSGILPGAS